MKFNKHWKKSYYWPYTYKLSEMCTEAGEEEDPSCPGNSPMPLIYTSMGSGYIYFGTGSLGDLSNGKLTGLRPVFCLLFYALDLRSNPRIM